MNFDNDVFISYAHLDNVPLIPGGDGWISNFHRALEVRLAQVCGKTVRIWRDPKLQGNDVLEAELLVHTSGAALLVSVVSPRYVVSDSCKKEITQFWVAAEKTGGAVIGTKARLFKVVKTPVELERMPEGIRPLLEPLLGYEFYRLNPNTKKPEEYDRIWGAEAETNFWHRLNDLAYDIAGLLEAFEETSQKGPSTETNAQMPSVYLATTTSDLAEQRDALLRELLRHGYTVFPERSLPLTAADLQTYLRDRLASCSVSIHLLGAYYGVVPEGSDESLTAVQASAAEERAKSGGLARLFWIPPGLAPKDSKQLELLEHIRRDPRLDGGADLLETPIEELKSLIHTRLKAAGRRSGKPTDPEPKPARIYVVCEIGDLEDVAPLRQHLFDVGHEAILPAFEGDARELDEDHQANLRDCDAMLLYYGVGSELWVRKKMGEMRQADSVRSRPALVRAICIARPASRAKQEFRTLEALTIALPDRFQAEALEPFLVRLGKR